MRTAVIYLVGVATAAGTWTAGLITGTTFAAVGAAAALSVALTAWFWLGRRRRPDAAAAVDGAPAAAMHALLAELERERDVLRASLRDAFADRSDTAAIIRDRNTALRRPADHPDADALPGESIIMMRTADWLQEGPRWRV